MTSEKFKIKSEFLRRLDIAMQKRGFDEDKKLADAADISPPSISGWRNGSSYPSNRFMKALADVLCVPSEWLAGKSDSEPNWDIQANQSNSISSWRESTDSALKKILIECIRLEDWGAAESVSCALKQRSAEQRIHTIFKAIS